MTVVVTRNVPMRFRGFLASTMLEVSPGVYTNPKLSRGVGQRIWNVLSEWFDHTGQDASIVMLWADGTEPAGQGVMVLGDPPRKLVEYDGVILSHLRRRAED
jgi:CRISPR-associated protein Cas2